MRFLELQLEFQYDNLRHHLLRQYLRHHRRLQQQLKKIAKSYMLYPKIQAALIIVIQKKFQSKF
jgi:hypothetical protein